MFSLSESQQIKGAAILIMLYLHLFNQYSNIATAATYLTLNGSPLVLELAKFTTICVPLYIIIGGYGLFVSWNKSKKLNVLRRVFLLYLNFWVVLLVFVFIGSLILPEAYPVSFNVFLKNLIGWQTSYNGEWWFLFPYIIIMLSSPLVFKLVNTFPNIIMVLSAIIYFVCIYLISTFGNILMKDYYPLYMIIIIFEMLFPFILGVMAVRKKWSEKLSLLISKFKYPNLVLVMFILMLVFAMIYTPFKAPLAPFVAISFFLSFGLFKKSDWLVVFLTEMGKNSTNMWLIHTFFCYYFFKDFIYGFKYPIIIFLVLLLLSYLSAKIIDIIYKPIREFVMNKLSN